MALLRCLLWFAAGSMWRAHSFGGGLPAGLPDLLVAVHSRYRADGDGCWHGVAAPPPGFLLPCSRGVRRHRLPLWLVSLPPLHHDHGRLQLLRRPWKGRHRLRLHHRVRADVCERPGVLPRCLPRGVVHIFLEVSKNNKK